MDYRATHDSDLMTHIVWDWNERHTTDSMIRNASLRIDTDCFYGK